MPGEVDACSVAGVATITEFVAGGTVDTVGGVAESSIPALTSPSPEGAVSAATCAPLLSIIVAETEMASTAAVCDLKEIVAIWPEPLKGRVLIMTILTLPLVWVVAIMAPATRLSCVTVGDESVAG